MSTDSDFFLITLNYDTAIGNNKETTIIVNNENIKHKFFSLNSAICHKCFGALYKTWGIDRHNLFSKKGTGPLGFGSYSAIGPMLYKLHALYIITQAH